MIKRENGVVIVDSIHYLLRDVKNGMGSLSLMKTLRRIAADFQVSILITAPMRPRTRVTRPVTLKDLAAARCVAELADTVFALCRSTLSPGHRYIKHLASRHAPVIHDGENVLAFQLLTGNAGIPASSPSTAEIGNAGIPASSSPVSPYPSLPASSSPSLPVSAFPFLRFIGPTPELPHITDYAAETQRRIAEETNRLRRLRNPRNLIEMLASPEYQRYIKGE
jgi:hypothetical protein